VDLAAAALVAVALVEVGKPFKIYLKAPYNCGAFFLLFLGNTDLADDVVFCEFIFTGFCLNVLFSTQFLFIAIGGLPLT
jgi:hypothetical protein